MKKGGNNNKIKCILDCFSIVIAIPLSAQKKSKKKKYIYLLATLTTTFFERTEPMPHRTSFAKQRYTPDVKFEY